MLIINLVPGGAGKLLQVHADETGTHVLEASTLEAAAAGTFTDGQEVKVDDYFTLYMSAKTKIDSSSKTWDDGYTSGQRINFGGKADIKVPKNVVSFKTEGPAEVKIWWVEGGDDHREVVIYAADGSVAAETTEGAGAAKNGIVYSELALDAAGTYFLCGKTNNNYLFKIEIAEVSVAAGGDYTLEANTLEAAAAGTFTDGQEVKADDYG